MSTVEIVGGTIIDGGRSRPGDLTLMASLISDVRDPGATGSADPSHRIDATGLMVAPGFVDLQINGGFGFDLLGNPTDLWDLARRLPEHGVTSFLPTIVTSPRSSTEAAMAALANRPSSAAGSDPLGLHFEGPMLSHARRGAHPSRHLVRPSLAVIEGWTADRGVRLVTIAPELPGALECIVELVRRGIVVSCGHTQATAAQAKDAVGAGATMVTHLFNAMDPLTHREPSLLAYALAEPDLIAGLIVDGVHIDPTVVKLAWNARGSRGLVLVTDAVAPMGRAAGSFDLGERTIVADSTSVRRPDGTLAGSLLSMDQAVRNTVEFTACSPAEAIEAATATPARLIGATDRGSLRVHQRADVVLLDDGLDVVATVCAGRVAYVSESGLDRLSSALRRTLAG